MAVAGLDEHVGRVLGQRYRLVAPVGTGASARVYLAEDVTLRRRVAVKLLHPALAGDPKFRKRFRAEAHASAQLSHPNIMAVYDWSDPDGAVAADATSAPAYLVTELLTGGSLRSLLDAGHRLSLSQALIVGLHAAEGLAYAHQNGFVHRDVKPANLLFGDEGRLRIADFGIARAVAEAAWTEPEGALVGTARYAAPEQASGSAIDGRADIYALAVTLIEAVTGECPLVAPTPLATMVLRQDTDLPVPDSMGPLADALRAAGRVDLESRSNASELAEALRVAASSLPRPNVLPLTGLEDDPRQSTPTGQRTIEAGTGVLILSDDPAIDLTTDVASDSASINGSEQLGGPVVEERRASLREAAPQRAGADDIEYVVEDERRRWPFLLLLTVLIVGAIIAYGSRRVTQAPEVITHPVGTYVGRPFDEVVTDIDLNNWQYTSTEQRSDGADVGLVIEQSPSPGTELTEGLEITLVVSEGPLLRSAPELEGRQLSEALDALADAGLFLGSTGEEYSESVPVRQVLSASVIAGNDVETGTKVDLVWSKGPAPRVIPALAGRPLADAVSEIEALGLVASSTDEYSQDVAEGDVIRVEPASGATVARGEAVIVVVSLGLPFVQVPNVIGLTAVEAADNLTNAGFKVVDTVGPPNSEVLATDPPAGESHRQGTEIIIFTRSG